MTTARAILTLLRTGDRLRGLELVRKSNGLVSRASVYVYLNRLEEAGFVRSFEVGKDPWGELTVRAWEITSTGRAALLRDDL